MWFKDRFRALRKNKKGYVWVWISEYSFSLRIRVMRIIIIHVLCSDGKVRVKFMYRFPGSNGIYCYNTLPTIRKRVTKKTMRNLITVDEKYSVDLEIGEKLYENVFESFLGLNYKAERIFYIYSLIL